MSIAIMARGGKVGGPVSAASAPYLGRLPNGNEESIATIRQAHYSFDADTDTIKGLLQEYGAVETSMLWPTSNEKLYYNSSAFAFRMVQDGEPDANHGVNIVGWDDTYSKAKFPEGNQPTSDGAWIVRNSWGTDWGNAGYFYMSYDTSLYYIGAYAAAPSADQKTYQYDFHGNIGSIGYRNSTAWFSNVFTADSNNIVKSVAFYTESPNASYEIFTRVGTDYGQINLGSTPIDTQAGKLPVPGYNRIDLETPFNVRAGEKFAVTVKLTDPGNDYPVGLSTAIPGFSESAMGSPGVGFISYNGSTWTDLYSQYQTDSICLKAFADIDTAIIPVSGLSLDKTHLILSAGETETLVATVLPSNATNKDIYWHSDNTSVASAAKVDGSHTLGHVTAAGPGTATITATSEADSTIIAACAVTVMEDGSIVLTDAPKALFVGGTATLRTMLLGNWHPADTVTWYASYGSISQGSTTSANYTAPAALPPGDGRATITATNDRLPDLKDQTQIQIRSLDFLKFDDNSKIGPQLLDLANAFGSTLKADLDKYDINGDGVIDDDDLTMLFGAMGW